MKVIPPQVLEEIRSRCDIVEVVGGYVRLARAGSAFKALCPFHKEKTPSFHVNPQRQIFHCFGCGKGGDVFRFVMDYEGVDFPTALRLLAKRAGVAVEFEDGPPGAREDKELLYRLHEELAAFYQRVLLDHAAGEPARAYLRARDLEGEAVRRFGLGFAPPQEDALLQWAAKRHYTPEQLVKGGLLVAGERGPHDYYDRFRGRLMIPIGDELGRVVGFSGRVLRAEDHPAKYVNSPETPLFRKGRILFALAQARRAMVDSRRAILCEGQLDTIRCHLAGVENVVGAQGTALTEEQARVLRRYADEVVLVLDPDTAGRRAAVRSAQVFLEAGLSVRVASLPEGEDPDSLIRKRGPEPFLAALAQAQSAVAFQVGLHAAAGALAGEAGRRRAAGEVLDTIARAPTDVQRMELLAQASRALMVPEDVLRRDLRARARRTGSAAPAADEAAAPAENAGPPPAEMALLELVAAAPEEAAAHRPLLRPELLAHPAGAEMLRRLLADGGRPGWRLSAQRPDDPEFTRLAARIEMGPPEAPGGGGAREVLRGVLTTLWRKAMERRRDALRARLAGLPAPERAALEVETAELTLRIKALGGGWSSASAAMEFEASRDGGGGATGKNRATP